MGGHSHSHTVKTTVDNITENTTQNVENNHNTVNHTHETLTQHNTQYGDRVNGGYVKSTNDLNTGTRIYGLMNMQAQQAPESRPIGYLIL
mmetsp:Transcript_5659/g.8956  ORF Transcript_5659/g.8956 Transcript_5659/m.8956 type:complete len:90 (-) Transcript_5659:23-292(-)|eukprot:CAMPEP_0170490808 /NCGR_PEP_ID=MMETSP0208-20121228/9626_1 /TAXON_ID=197538 /ORGANISM="Strombidium inclinatum, Strain S3" /LENGTH=89 /DNA_ID=CAMNT_0010766265 /DNA_START=31 /DNA_END=300 /DNA_ORIENTATION=+